MQVVVNQFRNKLNKACRKEELRMSEVQARDVRLRPKLMKLCSEEMLLFCDGMKQGGGRMFTCLLENVQKPTFGSMCKAEVLKREDRAKGDYRLDAGVSLACAADVAQHCADEKEKVAGEEQNVGHAEVLTCMVDRMADPSIELTESCEKQMSRCAVALLVASWLRVRRPFFNVLQNLQICC